MCTTFYSMTLLVNDNCLRGVRPPLFSSFRDGRLWKTTALPSPFQWFTKRGAKENLRTPSLLFISLLPPTVKNFSSFLPFSDALNVGFLLFICFEMKSDLTVCLGSVIDTISETNRPLLSPPRFKTVIYLCFDDLLMFRLTSLFFDFPEIM